MISHKTKPITFQNLKGKAVINACDGIHLGHIHDLEISEDYHQIISLILPKPGSFFRFSEKDYLHIPISQIEQIGEDVILVRFPSIH